MRFLLDLVYLVACILLSPWIVYRLCTAGRRDFALRFGVPIQPLSVQRVGPGARFRVLVHDQIRLEDTGDKAADIEAGVRRINAFIEERVRARPTEWFWVHRRWPNEEYRRSG